MNNDTRTIFEQYEDVINNTQGLPAPKSKVKVITKWDKENIENSHVHVQGVGVFTLAQIKENLAGKFEDLAKRVRQNEPEFVFKRMYERYGILKALLEALILAEKDIEHMRRSGQFPGAAKRFF